MDFTLDGQKFVAINGGPVFKFNESISFVINCEGQEEVDKFWNALTADGGKESQCGWLKDKFGLSWQVVPGTLIRLLQDKDPAKAKKAMHAMLQMRKIIVADLEKAAAGEGGEQKARGAHGGPGRGPWNERDLGFPNNVPTQ